MTEQQGRSKPWHARALELLEDGASYTEAAETVGVSRQTVAYRFPGRGWTNGQGGTYGRMIRDEKARELKSGDVSRNQT